MSNVEHYSLSSNFPSGLYNSQLKDEINGTFTTVICERIDTVDDDVQIVFNLELDIGEKSQLNDIILNYVPIKPPSIIKEDFYGFNNILNVVEVYQLNNYTLTSGSLQYPTGFTKINGLMDYFNPTTGIFNCTSDSPCVFLYNINIRSNSSNGNEQIKIRLQNSSNQTIFGNDNNLTQGSECWSFMGSGGVLTSADFIKYGLQVDTANMDCDITLRFLQLFC